MKTPSKKYEMDMCNGSLFPMLLGFSIPVILSGVLQLLFNAADMIVVGRFVGSDALAAVGSTGPLVNLLVNVFLGLSIGANVMVARYYGAGQKEELSDMVHTAILTSLVCGILLIFIGFFATPAALRLMGSPIEVIDQSILYLRIYFAGMPAMMVYNFGSAILRAVGDTKRPLFFLIIAGILNVLMNLFFVVVCEIGVAGVALATTLSQVVSAALVLICLMQSDGAYHLELKKLRINIKKLLSMARIGLPAGFQGAIFSISNVLIQSSINSFGAIAMAGNSVAGNLEGFVYTSMNAMHQTSVSFTSQNYGAKKYDRIKTICLECIAIVTVVGLVAGNLVYFFRDALMGLYTTDPEVMAFGATRLLFICCPYFICGLMDTMVGSIRGMGYSILPMLVSLTGACLFRIIWIYTIFAADRSLEILYLSYPVSWILTFCVHVICFVILYNTRMKKFT